jgi:flagellar biosynthesis protein FlhA|tara:strand:+ start:1175 stop:3301 length:2127 start_codon:yes stop_codon:yes gene_type:complete
LFDRKVVIKVDQVQSLGFSFSSFKKMFGSLLPLGILALVGMLVLPLPVFLLDLFFVFNITISLLILMVALHTHRPLDFSSFPNLLLLATVLRLGLNVASTRIVLSEGHNGTDAAGDVIQAFGEFIVAGNYTVGLFVFAILVIINLVVITKGAGRVSEVSARFTLDAMPGKQMAIDADLNAGVLTPEEATERRADVSKEAGFYGSMDGASKFVKGDAVAGILILAINVIGGLIIGVSQHGLSVAQAAENYILLSIGDGLVAQIPSLLLSIATAIIVTRVSSSENMSDHITKQVNLSAAWVPTSLVMLALGLVPGMPNLLFIGFALVTAFLAWNARNAGVELQAEDDSGTDASSEKEELEFGLDDVKDGSKVSLNIGYSLVALVDEGKSDNLVPKVTRLRKEISKSLGFLVPGVRIRDDLSLEASQYQIKIGQKIVADDLVYSDKKLAIPGDNTKFELPGLKVKEPAFGVEAYWIDPQMQADAELKGYVIVEPVDVLVTHLSQILNGHSADLLGQEEVQDLLDNLKLSHPSLVETVVPKILPLNQLTSIMKCILEESVPILDLRLILENLSAMNLSKMDNEDIAEALRPKLIPLLIQKLSKFKDTLPLITLAPELEQLILTTVRQNSDEKMLLLEGGLAKKILSNLNEASEEFNKEGKPVFLIVAPQIRRHVAKFVRAQLPSVNILSFTELPEDRNVEIAFTVGGFDAIE